MHRTPAVASALLSVLLAFAPCAAARTIRLDSAKTYLKQGQLAASPGDTVCIEPGRRLFQYIQGIHGTAEAPIVVGNCPGGRVLIGTTHHYGLFFDSVSHVRVTGDLDPAFPWGIHVDGTASGSGISVTGRSHHVEIDHIEVSGTNFAGIMAKQDYGGTPPSPIPEFQGLSIHHMRIHDTGGEGMYIGETKSPGMLFSDVEIHHNLLLRTGWDGLQLSNAQGARMHHNVVVAAGVLNELYQANGIQVGNNVGRIRIDHNVVIGSNENSLNFLGGGEASIDSNWFESPHGPQALFVDDRSMTDTGATISIVDNFWRRPTSLAWKIYDAPNPVVLSGNRIDPVDTLVVYAAGAGPTTVAITGTVQQTLADLSFVDSAGGDYRIPASSPYAFRDLGFGTLWSTGAEGRQLLRERPSSRLGRSIAVRGLPLSLPHPAGRRVRRD